MTLSHFPDQAGPGPLFRLNAAVVIPYKPTARWLPRGPQEPIWYHLLILQRRRLRSREGE